MTSTFNVADSSNDKDSPMILILNNDGTITVDPDTLNKLIANQHDGNVNFVRVDGDGSGASGGSADVSEVNLTIEGFSDQTATDSTVVIPASTASSEPTTDGADVVIDPFSEMDPEQLERLENALQSEQAKEILGTNLDDNLLDILEGNDSVRAEDSVHNDHSYTAPLGSSPLKPARGGGSRRGASATPSTTPSRGARSRGGRSGRGSAVVSKPGTVVLTTKPALSSPSTPVARTTAIVAKTARGTQRIIFKRGAKIISAPANGVVPKGPKIVQRRVLAPKPAPASAVTSANDATALAAQSLVDMASELQSTLSDTKESANPATTKKKDTPTGRATKRGRGGKASAAPSVQNPEDDMVAALEALGVGKSPPLTPPTTHAKKEPKSRGKNKSPEVKGEGDAHKKKEKARPIGSLGPELFSTPDIIRRVSSDRRTSCSEPHETETHDTEELTVEERLQRIDEHPLPIAPANKAEEKGTAESLLVSLTQDIKEDTGILLTDTLFIEELTSQVLSDKGKEMTIPSLVEGVVDDLGKTKEQKTPLRVVEVPKLTSKASTPKVVIAKPPVVKIRKRVLKDAPQLEIIKMKSPHLNKKLTVVIKEKKPAAGTPPSKATPSLEKKRTSTRKRVLTEKAAAFMSSMLGSETEPVVEPVEEPTPEPEPVETLVSPDAEEDDAESDADSWRSEDDPDRLWCICRKPHNNRFMIACDKCEDWFHGKCVGISKALGKKMEEDGVEWTCPNCQKDKLTPKPKTPTMPTTPKTTPKLSTPEQKVITSLSCLTCNKPAKISGCYCSDACIKKHVLNRLLAIKRETHRLHNTSRVVVRERSSNHLLTGDAAPTADTLLDWMLAHPTYEVVEPSSVPNYVKLDQPKPPAKKQGTLKQTVLTPKGANKQVLSFAPKGAVTVKTPATPKAPAKIESQAPAKTTMRKVSSEKEKKQSKIIPSSGGSSEKKPSTPTTSKTPPASTKDHPPASKAVTSAKAGSHVKTAPTSNKTAVSNVTKSPPTPKTPTTAKTPPIPAAPIEKKKLRRDSESSAKAVPVTKEPEKSTPSSSQEPVRANVRRTLQELLTQRMTGDSEFANVTPDQVKELSVSIEEELFKVFNDTGAKYKSKYRSLVFNIKDAKNTLYKKIIGKSVTPAELVRLTPEELASQELAKWREQEAKHSIDIIKKSELDLIHQGNTVLLKSRKGEEVIEVKPLETSISELESALNRTADDLEEEYQVKKEMEARISEEELQKLEEKLKGKDKEGGRERRRDRKKRRSRSKDRSRSHSSRHQSRSSHKSRHSSRSKRSHSHERKDKKKKEKEELKEEKTLELKEEVSKEELSKEEVSVMDVELNETVDDSEFDIPVIMPLDLKEEIEVKEEPTSTVIIATPPPTEDPPWLWNGTLHMVDVTRLHSRAYHVSGPCDGLSTELADHLECVGRISPDSVWDYVARMKKSGTKEIVVIRFCAESEEEKMHYLSLYSYLNSRNRMAVIGTVSRTVKDFYVLPLASHAPVPQILLPLDGPGFDDYRPHLLLGIIVRTRKKSLLPVVRVSNISENYLSGTKSPERSYTPPLPPEPRGSTPPLPKPHRGITPPPLDDDEPYEPEDDSPYDPGEDSLSSCMNPPAPEPNDIQKNLEEVQRMIDEKKQKIETLAALEAQSTAAFSVDDDTNYSSGSFTPPRPSDSTIPFLDNKMSGINIPTDLHHILASIKTPERSESPGAIDMNVAAEPIVKQYASTFVEEHLEDEDYRRPELRPDVMTPQPLQQSLHSMSEEDLVKKASEMGYAPENFPPPVSGYYPPIPPKPALPTAPPPQYLAPPLPQPQVFPPAPGGGPPLAGPPLPSDPPPAKFKDMRGKRHAEAPVPPPERYNKRRQGGGTWGIGSNPPPPPVQPPRGHPRGAGGHRRGPPRGNFRPQFQHRPYPHRYHDRYYNRPKFDGIQSEWDEEIRQFEQRKAAERRKRRISRSPSPKRSRSRRSPQR